jgi:hypothetical protein
MGREGGVKTNLEAIAHLALHAHCWQFSMMAEDGMSLITHPTFIVLCT